MAGSYITSDDWAKIQHSLGVEAAARWRRDNGIQINDEAVSPSDRYESSGELPAQDEAAYAAAGQDMGAGAVPLSAGGPDPGYGMEPDLAVNPGETEDETADAGGATSLAAKPSASLNAKGLDILDASRKNVAAIYDQAAQRLRDVYRGPSTGEMLVAMGAAMLKPTGSGSFGEALGNALGVMPEYLRGRREYHNAYGKELAALQRAYAHDITGLEGRYLTASGKAPPQSHAAADQTGGRFWTSGPLVGMPIAPPDQIAYALEHQSDPEVVSVFNRQYGRNAIQVYAQTYVGGQ